MRRMLFVALMVLLLHAPFPSRTSAAPQNSEAKAVSEAAAPEKTDRFPDSEDDIFSASYEREKLSQRSLKKSLPALSRKEKIIWSFRTAKANTFL